MSVVLSGELRCAGPEQALLVSRHLPRYIELTRAEPGCLSFEVTATGDPLVWRVEETFASDEDFRAHTARTADSEWGVATAGISRDYVVTRPG